MKSATNDFVNFVVMCLGGILICLLFWEISKAVDSKVSVAEEEDRQLKRENKCMSKYSGSAPRCWSSADWKAYCEHVQCKNITLEK